MHLSRMDTSATTFGRLGDTPARDYSPKLRLFNALAEPELRAAIANLALKPGMFVLDAGCGTGETLGWLTAAVMPGGLAVGVDLSAGHLEAARTMLPRGALLVQADLPQAPLAAASFDLVWAVNSVHHLSDPPHAVHALAALLRPGGRLALGQSSLLPEMYFAWDARLERVTHEAVRAYYRDRYHLSEQELTAVRALVGLLRAASLSDVSVRTVVIERVAPLDPAAHAWLLEALFRGTFGERLRPYLAPADYEELARLCDPAHPQFALRRRDFHFLQTFTLAIGSRPPPGRRDPQ
jgi:SAM-dependent methyltransferase